MTGKDECGSREIKGKIKYGLSESRKPLTHPRAIRDRSSVSSVTNSSSSIAHVPLVVKYSFGINNVVTKNLLSLSLPNNNPHVSWFLAVLMAAMDKNLERQSRGKLTFFISLGIGFPARSGALRIGAGGYPTNSFAASGEWYWGGDRP